MVQGSATWRLTVAFLGATACLSQCSCRMVSATQNAQGVQLFQQGNYQGALQKFQQAIYTNPNDADGYYNLAATLQRLGGVQNQKSLLDQAESYYHQAIDHNPNHTQAYRGLAVLLKEQSRSEDAFKLLEGWAERSPLNPEAKIELARLFDETGDKKAAKAHLLEALERDPYNARALAALGKIHEELGDREQALAVYQRSLWHNQTQPEVAARIASLQSALGPQPVITPPGGTRTVGAPGAVYR
jgi:tetratricopeptide (TPR) repeat protein